MAHNPRYLAFTWVPTETPYASVHCSKPQALMLGPETERPEPDFSHH